MAIKESYKESGEKTEAIPIDEIVYGQRVQRSEAYRLYLMPHVSEVDPNVDETGSNRIDSQLVCGEPGFAPIVVNGWGMDPVFPSAPGAGALLGENFKVELLYRWVSTRVDISESPIGIWGPFPKQEQ